MVLGVIIYDQGLPICCEMQPGNTANVKSLLPLLESLRMGFAIRSFCIVADPGMISAERLSQLESPKTHALTNTRLRFTLANSISAI